MGFLGTGTRSLPFVPRFFSTHYLFLTLNMLESIKLVSPPEEGSFCIAF